MYQQTSIIPDDNVIIVDGKALFFAFPALENIHAIQWKNGAGWIEYKDNNSKKLLGADYVVEVLPFIKLWEAENTRLEEANRSAAPTLEDIRQQKLSQINESYEVVMGYIQAGYPLKEVLSWDTQYLQSKELLENPEASAIFVRQLATQKNISLEEMRDRILANATSWQYVAGLLTAQRQMMEEAALLAESVEGLEAVKVAFSV